MEQRLSPTCLLYPGFPSAGFRLTFIHGLGASNCVKWKQRTESSRFEVKHGSRDTAPGLPALQAPEEEVLWGAAMQALCPTWSEMLGPPSANSQVRSGRSTPMDDDFRQRFKLTLCTTRPLPPLSILIETAWRTCPLVASLLAPGR